MTKKPAKKKGAPKKSDALNPHPGVMPAELEQAIIDVAPEVAVPASSSAKLRFDAQLVYVYDLNQPAVVDISEMKEFKGRVSLVQLTKWCTDDGWVAKREAYHASLQERIGAAIGDKVVKRHVELLGKIRIVVDKAVDHFIPHPFEPHDLTFEEAKQQCLKCGRLRRGHDNPFYGDTGSQVASALAKIVDVDLALTRAVTQGLSLTPPPGEQNHAGSDAETALTSTLTAEEAQDAACGG